MRFALFCLLSLLLVACSEPKPPKQEVIRPIAWTKVKASHLEQIRTLSGVVAPIEATHLSFEVNGKIQTVNVKLGNQVTQGQELARLNQRSFKLSLQSAQAQLEQAKASQSETENEYRRYEQLVDQGVVSQSGFDNAKAMFESAKSAVDVAQAQLDIARKNLQDSILTAPYDGIITKRLIEPSQQISAGQAAFEIEGKHGMEVRIMVPETLIQELKQDAHLAVRFPVIPNIEMQGIISEIGTRAESANAFPITVVLEQDNPSLRAGMTAEVDVTFDGIGLTGFSGDTVTVPVSALASGLDQQVFVFVFDPQTQQLTKRLVQTENIMSNEVYLSAGLTEGEIIATAGVAFLRDGQKVTLLENNTQVFN